MRKIITLFLITILGVHLSAQSCLQKEIKTTFTNGHVVFNICNNNPNIIFDESKEYFWYNQVSGIKSTKGGSGGNLLHGNYKSYDEYGNLRVEENYSLGLRVGKGIQWDTAGNIISKSTYNDGVIIYLKQLNEEDLWIEFNGPLWVVGSNQKMYTKYGILISEEVVLERFKKHVKQYFEYPLNQLKQEYTSSGLSGNYRYGKYVLFYKNGQVKVEGQYSKRELTKIQVGEWKWYNEDGSVEVVGSFKDEVILWPNGKIKIAGGLMLDPKTKNWTKVGEWRWYDENGEFLEKKIFEYGDEITK